MAQTREAYNENGYVVVRGAVDSAAIDKLVALYRRDIVASGERFYRQNTNKYERNRLNGFGYVQQAFLDIHDYARHPEFSRAALEIFTSEPLLASLREATGFERLNLMQSMFFDQNAATAAHQDWWYLDSVPNGHLFGVWIALEDIDERAGRFYLVRKSHLVDLHSGQPGLAHSEWAAKMRAYVEEHRAEVSAPELKKGDIIVWNSGTVHGALPTRDERFSRRSLTAHYLPAQYEFGNIFTVKRGLRYKTFNGVRYYRNQPDYTPLNALRFEIRWQLHNKPRVMRALRVVQRTLGQIRATLS